VSRTGRVGGSGLRSGEGHANWGAAGLSMGGAAAGGGGGARGLGDGIAGGAAR
jgi:hypothetical protein